MSLAVARRRRVSSKAGLLRITAFLFQIGEAGPDLVFLCRWHHASPMRRAFSTRFVAGRAEQGAWGQPALQGTVMGIARGITDRGNRDGPELLSSVNPTFTWVRLAQRIPVRIRLTQVPERVLVSAGMTCRVIMKDGMQPIAASMKYLIATLVLTVGQRWWCSDALRRVFEGVVAKCIAAGLVGGREIFIDGA
jgi:hypothetical protein